MLLRFFLFDRKFLQNFLSNKNLSEGSHCGGYVDVAHDGPPQAVNPAKQDSFLCDGKFLLDSLSNKNDCHTRISSSKAKPTV